MKRDGGKRTDRGRERIMWKKILMVQLVWIELINISERERERETSVSVPYDCYTITNHKFALKAFIICRVFDTSVTSEPQRVRLMVKTVTRRRRLERVGKSIRLKY